MTAAKRTRFFAIGIPAALILAWVFAKGLYLIGTLGNPLSIYGAVAFFRLEPEEFSFFGLILGLTLGFLIAARMTGLGRGETLDRMAIPGAFLIAVLRFLTLFWGELGLGEFGTLGITVSDGTFGAFWPLGIRDNWGEWWLAVSTLEALTAIGCGIYGITRREKFIAWDGWLFERMSIILCSAQLFLELLHSASTVTYFVHTEQAYCAVYILIRVILACREKARVRKGFGAWKRVIFAVLWIAMNGILQFIIDKPYDFLAPLPTAVGDWLSDHLAPVGYGLILLSCIGTGVNALKAGTEARTERNRKETK